jgi:hypothetical protein
MAAATITQATAAAISMTTTPVTAAAVRTMTDGRRRIPVAAIAGGLFCLVLINLALQVRAGNDPAIGAGSQTAAAPQPRQVIVRRIIIRRIIEEDAPAPAAGSGTAGSSGDASAPAAGAATSSAPAPAPAPAAPAPVVSRGS